MTRASATPRVLLAAAAVMFLTSVLYFKDLGRWSWDHDEVSGLVEAGASQVSVASGVQEQLARARLAVPAWYAVQSRLLTVLPVNEFGSRVLSAICGVLVVGLIFVTFYLRRGQADAYASAVLIGLSQPFIWLAQNNRFYMMAMLFSIATLLQFWKVRQRPWLDLGLIGVTSLIAVTSHNLLVVFFCLCFAAAVGGFLVGYAPAVLLYRTGVAAAVSIVVYVFYLRPILTGWVTGGLGGTSAPVSFAAMLGIPTIALAVVGAAASWLEPQEEGDGAVLSLVGLASLAFITSWPLFLKNWNPGYAFFFFPPFWFLAVKGVGRVSAALTRPMVRGAWYLCVVILLLPKTVSHFVDGSRHDMRAAAALVAAELRDGEAVYANWPTELQYYLQASRTPVPVVGWGKGSRLPDSSCILVYTSNAFEPVLAPEGRDVTFLGQIVKRRYDEQSFVVRVYRMTPVETTTVHAPADGIRPQQP